ncbi:MAG: GNAT family N-acetyltransferase [Bacteroidales bacterium]|nr:GNAT family N-acetyltransferase [Bacteroidales bacterium]
MDSDSRNAGHEAGMREDSVSEVPPQHVAIPHPVVPVALHAPELEEGIGYRPILSEHDPDFDFLYEIYTEAFPPEERRSREQLIEEMGQPEVCVGLITYEGERAGFFIYWELEDFIYGGHFAIHEDLRGDGIGTSFLSQFLRWAPKPVIIEVEPPTNRTAKRRIAFYEKLGLKLFPCDYVQPAYDPDKDAVPLYLMEAAAHTDRRAADAQEAPEVLIPDDALLPWQYEQVKKNLYEYVYADCKLPQ